MGELDVPLPGYAWLRRNLDTIEADTGGYERKMGSTVMPGAGLVMKAVLIAAWLVSLPCLAVAALARRGLRR